MKLIVISPPDFIPEEVAAVNALLEKDSGFVFHLRKPEAERMEFEGYLKEINPDFYSRIMIHQPLGSYSGQASDIKIHAEEIIKIRSNLNKILAHHTEKNITDIEKDTERDYFMSAEEALNYGLIDKIIYKRD